MRMNEMHPSKWLAAADLEGDDVVATIKRVTMEEVGRDGDRKPVIMFEELAKGMVANVTNCKTIAKLFGDDTDDWLGKQVTLYEVEVPFNGEQVAAIRVRSKPKPAKKTSAKASKAMTQEEVDADNGERQIPF